MPCDRASWLGDERSCRVDGRAPCQYVPPPVWQCSTAARTRSEELMPTDVIWTDAGKGTGQMQPLHSWEQRAVHAGTEAPHPSQVCWLQQGFSTPLFYQLLLLGGPGELAACPQNTSTKPWLSRATQGLVHHHSPLSPQQQARSICLWFGTTARNHLKTQPCPHTSSPHPFSLLLAQQGFRTPRPSRNPRSGLPELPSLTHCCCFGPADKRSQCQGLPACQDRTGNCGREN